MKLKSDKEYCACAGEETLCPACGFDMIEGGRVTIVGRLAIQEISCTNCDGTWNDVYRLVGYSYFRDAYSNPIDHEEGPHRIIVRMAGGLVQGVDDIPPGVAVEVRDFELEGEDVEARIRSGSVQHDDKGEPYSQLVFHSDGKISNDAPPAPTTLPKYRVRVARKVTHWEYLDIDVHASSTERAAQYAINEVEALEASGGADLNDGDVEDYSDWEAEEVAPV